VEQAVNLASFVLVDDRSFAASVDLVVFLFEGGMLPEISRAVTKRTKNATIAESGYPEAMAALLKNKTCFAVSV
jgi:hypothetical protein